MDVNNLARVLKSFDTEKQSFGYNPANRNTKRFRVSPMIQEDANMVSKEVLEARFKADQEEGMKMYRKEYEMAVNEAGSAWSASNSNFRRGACKTARFIEGDDNEDEAPTFTNSRFSKGIDIKKALTQSNDRRKEKVKEEKRANFEMNRVECQHMDFNTSRNDPATRAVIRERQKNKNIDRDYNQAHEIGNTHNITKERSRNENINIVNKINRGRGLLLRTTLVSTDEGNCSERNDLMSDRNTEIMYSNTADDANYRNMISRTQPR